MESQCRQTPEGCCHVKRLRDKHKRSYLVSLKHVTDPQQHPTINVHPQQRV